MGTLSSVSGGRARNTGNEKGEPLATETPGTGTNGKRPRGEALATVLAVDMSVVQEHDQWCNPALKTQVEALQSSVVKGVDGAISAWVADECNRVSGQDLSPEEGEMHAELAHEGKLHAGP